MSATIEPDSSRVNPRKPTSSICPILSRRLGPALGVALGAADGVGGGDGVGTNEREGETRASRQAAATAATPARPTVPRKRRRVIGPMAPILPESGRETGAGCPDTLQGHGAPPINEAIPAAGP